MISKTTLDTELQDYLASTSNIKADANKRVRTLNTVLNKLSQYNWMFTIKKITFTYVAGTYEYSLATIAPDFKENYYLDNKTSVDARQFDSTREMISFRIKNNVNYLLCNLGTEDDTFDFEYFSNWMVTNTGVYSTQEEFTTDGTNESFVGPTDMKPLIVEMAYYELLRKSKNADKNERIEVQNNISDLLNKAINSYGYNRKKGIKRIMIRR